MVIFQVGHVDIRGDAGFHVKGSKSCQVGRGGGEICKRGKKKRLAESTFRWAKRLVGVAGVGGDKGPSLFDHCDEKKGKRMIKSRIVR